MVFAAASQPLRGVDMKVSSHLVSLPRPRSLRHNPLALGPRNQQPGSDLDRGHPAAICKPSPNPLRRPVFRFSLRGHEVFLFDDRLSSTRHSAIPFLLRRFCSLHS
jgi:hypothetical protein